MKNNNRRKNYSSSNGKSRTFTKKDIVDKEKYYAFFDAEYTCYMDSDTGFDRNHSNEVLSVGVVIADKNFQLVKTYYSPIHPIYNGRLTRYCKSLTGLTQKEIDNAPTYDEVFQELYLLFQKYPVREIFTWGNDVHTLCDDIEKNHKFVAKRHKRIVHLLQDLTKKLTQKVFGKGITVSLSDMKYICDMEHCTAHNALEDAEDLYRITKCCVQGDYNKEKAKILYEYIQNRDIYHRYRKFKHPFAASEKAELCDISLQYIEILKKYYKKENEVIPPEILAMCDDVRSLMGRQNEDCPKLPE